MYLLDNIKRNIANLRFSIEFDTHDLTQTQQAMLLNKVDDILTCVENVESELVK